MHRREFLLGSMAAAFGLAAFGDQAFAADPPPPTRVLDDPSIQHGKVVFQHDGKDTIGGYLARPKAARTLPPVLVIAGNRISEEYIPNTCAALAVAGFVGLAPDIFHPLPDAAKSREAMDAALAHHKDLDVLLDVQQGADYLKSCEFVRAGVLGVVGFCYGGRIALLFAARSRDVDAVVPFHPGAVTSQEIARLACPVQIHCGTADPNVSVESIESLRKTLVAQSTPVEVYLYEGAAHGFLAYTRPTYQPEAAQLAWSRTTAFLHRHLG